MVGPHATDEALVTRRAEILENPRVWVAQPTLSISTTLTVTNDGDLAPRHVDLRPLFCKVLSSGAQLVGFVGWRYRKGLGCEFLTRRWIKRFLGCCR